MKALFAALALTALTAAPAGATTFVFTADLLGANETPPIVSPGVGFARVTWNDVADTMRVQVTFSDLLGSTTAAHIHAGPLQANGTRGVATQVPSFPGFPLGVMSGSYDQTFDMTLPTSYSPGFLNTLNGGSVANAQAFLFNALQNEESYLNVHTNLFPAGEIRGTLSYVPEPGTWALMITGFGGVGAILRRRRSGTLAAA